jgi:hypothetical protein
VHIGSRERISLLPFLILSLGRSWQSTKGWLNISTHGTTQWSLSQAAAATEERREEFVRRIMETHQRCMPRTIGEILDFVTKRKQIQPAIFF